MQHPLRLIAFAVLPLALMACVRQPASQQDLDDLDRDLTGTGNGRDPVLAAALRDQIMVDPALAQSSNVNAVRPPGRPAASAMPPDGIGARPDGIEETTLTHAPASAGCPDCKRTDSALTLGELAKRQTDRRIADCAPQVRYSADWANRLPADVPLYPDARVIEAAGADCGLRIVNFVSNAPTTKVIDWYYTQLDRVGYSAEHQAEGAQHVLGGSRGAAAYMLYASPHAGGGSDVDLISSGGR